MLTFIKLKFLKIAFIIIENIKTTKPGIWNPIYTLIKTTAKFVAKDKRLKEFLFHEIDREERKLHIKAVMRKK